MSGTEPGDYLGICLDTMNLMTMLEDPLLGAERILPWVVSTHVKDGGILLSKEGFKTFPSEIGFGVVKLKEIIKRLQALSCPVQLSIEDHGGDIQLPIFDHDFLKEFPDLSSGELAGLMNLSMQTREKMDKNLLVKTKSTDWPQICEDRTARNIDFLKMMTEQLQ